MPVRRLDEDGPAAVQAALGDASVLARYRAKIVTVPGSECLWWAHAVSGRGHGRFWLARGRVVIAHRFGFAVMHGVDALADAALLGHRCHNPLCQRIAPFTSRCPRRCGTVATGRSGATCPTVRWPTHAARVVVRASFATWRLPIPSSSRPTWSVCVNSNSPCGEA